MVVPTTAAAITLTTSDKVTKIAAAAILTTAVATVTIPITALTILVEKKNNSKNYTWDKYNSRSSSSYMYTVQQPLAQR